MNLLETKSPKSFMAVIICFMLTLAPYFSSAQAGLSITLRPNVNFAVKKLGDADLKTGFGGELDIAYSFLPNLGVYAGWGWNKFNAKQSFIGADTDFEETGYAFGLQLNQPIGATNFGVLVRGGAIYKHIESENAEGKLMADTGHGWGWQADAGLSIQLGNYFQIIPNVRYQALAREFTIGNVTTPVDLNYVSIGLDLTYTF